MWTFFEDFSEAQLLSDFLGSTVSATSVTRNSLLYPNHNLPWDGTVKPSITVVTQLIWIEQLIIICPTAQF